jgi:hypothetical protein
VKADAQSVEQEALQWATDWFRDCAGTLSVEGSRRFLAASAVNSFLEAYDRAKDGGADDKITVEDYLYELQEEQFTPDLRCAAAAALLERNEHLPTSLREFVVDFLRNPKVKRKAGRDFNVLRHRNKLIAETIQIIAERWKFHPTRNDATEGASAASIVRDALAAGAELHLTEAAINKIWRRFGPGAKAWLSRAKIFARLERLLEADPDFEYDPPKYAPLLDSIGINYDD